MCKNGGQQTDERQGDWKQAQDQPQFSNPNNRCLHCAGDHGSHTGINSQYSPHFSQPSTPQHSVESHFWSRLDAIYSVHSDD